MTTWIASDIHLNHRNILSYCPERRLGRAWPVAKNPNDKEEVAAVYEQISLLVSDMNEYIIAKWNSVVAPDDTVYILGDVAMGQIEFAPALIRAMNGKKYLVRGNHDYTLAARIHKQQEGYTDLFEGVYNDMRLKYKTSDTGRKTLIHMYHFPVSHWEGMNQGTLHLYGHLHGSPSGLTGRIKDVGIDTNGLKPYKLDDVVNELLAIEVIRDHHDNE